MPIITPKIPDGLPELMRGLAKSIIKENPKNIYLHAAEYFENLLRERDGDLEKSKKFTAYRVLSDLKNRSAKSREQPSCNCGKRVSTCSQTSEIIENVASAGKKKKKSAKKVQRPETVEAGSRVISTAGVEDEMKLTENTHQFIFETPGEGQELNDVPIAVEREKPMSNLNAVKPTVNTRSMSGGVKNEVEIMNPIEEGVPNEMHGKAIRQAVVKIQAFYRGFMVRKEIVTMKRNRAVVAEAATGGVVTAAAVGIVSAIADKISAGNDVSAKNVPEMNNDPYGDDFDEEQVTLNQSANVTDGHGSDNDERNVKNEGDDGDLNEKIELAKSATSSAKSEKSQTSKRSTVNSAKSEASTKYAEDPLETEETEEIQQNDGTTELCENLGENLNDGGDSDNNERNSDNDAIDDDPMQKSKLAKMSASSTKSEKSEILNRSSTNSAKSQASNRSAASSANSVKSQKSTKLANDQEEIQESKESQENVKPIEFSENLGEDQDMNEGRESDSAPSSAKSEKSPVFNKNTANSAKSEIFTKEDSEEIEDNPQNKETIESGENQSENDYDDDALDAKSAPSSAKSGKSQNLNKSATNSAKSNKSQASYKSAASSAKSEKSSRSDVNSPEMSRASNRSAVNSAKSVASLQEGIEESDDTHKIKEITTSGDNVSDNDFEDEPKVKPELIKNTANSAKSEKSQDSNESTAHSAKSNKSHDSNRSANSSAKSIKSQASDRSAANSAKSEGSTEFADDQEVTKERIQHNDESTESGEIQGAEFSNIDELKILENEKKIGVHEEESKETTESGSKAVDETVDKDQESPAKSALITKVLSSADEKKNPKKKSFIKGLRKKAGVAVGSVAAGAVGVTAAVKHSLKSNSSTEKNTSDVKAEKHNFVGKFNKRAGKIGASVSNKVTNSLDSKTTNTSDEAVEIKDENIPKEGKAAVGSLEEQLSELNVEADKTVAELNAELSNVGDNIQNILNLDHVSKNLDESKDATASKRNVEMDDNKELLKSIINSDEKENDDENISQLDNDTVEVSNNEEKRTSIENEQGSPNNQSFLGEWNAKAQAAAAVAEKEVRKIDEEINHALHVDEPEADNIDQEKYNDVNESPEINSFLEKLNAKADDAAEALEKEISEMNDGIKHTLHQDLDETAFEEEVNEMGDKIKHALHLDEPEPGSSEDNTINSDEKHESPKKLSLMARMNAKADAAAAAMEKEVSEIGDSLKHALHLDEPDLEKQIEEIPKEQEDSTVEMAEVNESLQKLSFIGKMNAKADAAAATLEKEVDEVGNSVKNALHLDEPEKGSAEDVTKNSNEKHESPKKLSFMARMNAKADAAAVVMEKEVSEIGDSIKHALHLEEPDLEKQNEEKPKESVDGVEEITEVHESPQKLSFLGKLNAKADAAAAALEKDVSEMGDNLKHALHFDEPESNLDNELTDETHESPKKLSFMARMNAKADDAAAAMEKEVSEIGDSLKHALHLDEPDLEKQFEEKPKEPEDSTVEIAEVHESPQKLSFLGKLNAKADSAAATLEKEVNEMGNSLKHALHLDEPEPRSNEDNTILTDETHESPKKLSFMARMNAKADDAAAAMEKEVSEIGDSLKHALYLDEPDLEKQIEEKPKEPEDSTVEIAEVHESPQKLSFLGKLNAKADSAAATLEKEVDEMSNSLKHALHLDEPEPRSNEDNTILTDETHESPKKLSFMTRMNAKADDAAAAMEKEVSEIGDSIKHALHLDEPDLEKQIEEKPKEPEDSTVEIAEVHESPQKLSFLGKLNAKADSAAATLEKEVDEMGNSLKHALHLDEPEPGSNEDNTILADENHESPKKLSFMARMNAKADAAAAAMEKEVSEIGDSLKHALHLDEPDLEKQIEKPKETEDSTVEFGVINESPQKLSFLGKLNAKADSAAATLEKEVDEMGNSLKHALHLDEPEPKSNEDNTILTDETHESPKKLSFMARMNAKADDAAAAMEKEVSEIGDSLKHALHLDEPDLEKQIEEKPKETEDGTAEMAEVHESPQKLSFLGKLNAKADSAAATLEKEVDEIGNSLKHALHLDEPEPESNEDNTILTHETHESPKKLSFMARMNAKADAAAAVMEKEVSEIGDSLMHALHLDEPDLEKQIEEKPKEPEDSTVEIAVVHESPHKLSFLGKLNAKTDSAAATLDNEINEKGDGLKDALHLDEPEKETIITNENVASPEKLSFLGRMNAKADAANAAVEKEISEMGESLKHALHLDNTEELENLQELDDKKETQESPQKLSLSEVMNAKADSASTALSKEVNEISDGIKHVLHLDKPEIENEDIITEHIKVTSSSATDQDSDDVVVVNSVESPETTNSPTFMAKLNAKADAASAALEAEVAEITDAIKHTFHIGENETENLTQANNKEELETQIDPNQNMSEIDAKNMATKVVEEVVETAEAIKNSLNQEIKQDQAEDGINEEIATVLTATLTQREKFEARIAAASLKKSDVEVIETQDCENKAIILDPDQHDDGNHTQKIEPEPHLIVPSQAEKNEANADKNQDDGLEISTLHTATQSQREKFDAKIAAAIHKTKSEISSDIDETESGVHDPHSISNQTTMDIAGADDLDPLLANYQSSTESAETNYTKVLNTINKAGTSPLQSADEKKSRSKRSILMSPIINQKSSDDQPNLDTSLMKKLDKKAAAVIAGGAAALGTVFAIKGSSSEKTPSDEDNEGIDTVDSRKSAKSGSGRLRSRIPVKTQKSKEIEIKKSVENSTPVGSPKEIIQPSAPPLSEVEETNVKPTEELSSSPTDTDNQSIKDYQGDEPFVNMNGKLLNQISYEFSDDFSEESKPPQKEEEDQDDDNDSGEEELIRRFTRLRKTSITETDEETGEVTQTRIEEYEEYSMVWEANDEEPVSVEEPTCISRSVSATTIISNDNDSDNFAATPDLIQKSDVIDEEEDKPPTPETTKRIKTELAEIEHCEAEANKDSIEAMFYNLKKKELEQDLKMSATEKKVQNLTKQVTEDDDDIVFVNAEEDEASDSFNPMEQALRRNKQLLEQLHGRKGDNSVEDEDQFDEFQPGNIRKKILASSFSKADSDYYDPTDPAAQVNENNIKTALETITSTDSESSTIVSAATKIQAGARGYLARKQVQSIRSSSSVQPQQASFGNAAINQSLDDMIEQQQKQNLRMEQEAAIRIQRTYRNFLNTRRVEFNQQRAFTEDLSNHSYDDRDGGPIIEVKMEKRSPGKLSSGDRRSVDSVDSIQYEPLEETNSELKRRSKFFQSLNVDVYNTAARRQTFVRGDAVNNNSTPENDSGKSNTESTELVQKSAIAELIPDVTKEKQVVATTSTTTQPSSTTVAVATEARKRKNRLTFGIRQRSMPVQIETTIIRVLPKHLRKRIKSADGEAKKKRYITSSFEHFF